MGSIAFVILNSNIEIKTKKQEKLGMENDNNS